MNDSFSRRTIATTGLAFILALSSSRLLEADIVVFNDNFNGAIPTEISGPAVLSGVQGFLGEGNGGNVFDGFFLQNSAPVQTPTVLTLTGLPSHDSISINFLLAILESWDGGGSVPGAAPDLLGVRVDGNLIFLESFETTGVSAQSYVPPVNGALFEKENKGNWGHSYPESGYDMGLDPAFQLIPHTANTLTVEWFADGAGWQGGGDESWALDNLTVTVHNTAIPEPGTASLLILAAMFGVVRLRTRKGN